MNKALTTLCFVSDMAQLAVCLVMYLLTYSVITQNKECATHGTPCSEWLNTYLLYLCSSVYYTYLFTTPIYYILLFIIHAYYIYLFTTPVYYIYQFITYTNLLYIPIYCTYSIYYTYLFIIRQIPWWR